MVGKVDDRSTEQIRVITPNSVFGETELFIKNLCLVKPRRGNLKQKGTGTSSYETEAIENLSPKQHKWDWVWLPGNGGLLLCTSFILPISLLLHLTFVYFSFEVDCTECNNKPRNKTRTVTNRILLSGR